MIRFYVGTLAAIAAGLLAYLFLTNEESIDWVRFSVFLGLFVLAESKPVLLPKIRVAFTVTFMMVIVAVIHLPPAAVALASLLSAVGARPGGKWLSPLKLLFNSTQTAIAGGCAALTYATLGGTRGIQTELLLPVVASVAAATGVFFLINSAAVSGAVALSTRTSFLRTWLVSHGWTAATYVAFGASGIVLAALYQLVDILALPLLLVPLLVARSAFHSYQEVSEAYESTVLAFVGAIEAKDVYTRGHSERVAEYGRMIAERISIRDPDLTVFYYGALLHDVGKLVVRKSILTKPSSLTIEEFNEIKRHPGLGAQIVKDIEFLQPAVEAVLYHHERLDGSGYPAGLSGDLISPWARIMAVADTYDAMTSTRAYRGARTPGEAIEELKRCAGLQLDARCVDALIEALDELEPARARKGYETEVVPGAAG
ncbi:MAG: HD-GYP domain-containing protein [Actinomycetota bacterium]